jgi:hypothetical protein
LKKRILTYFIEEKPKILNVDQLFESCDEIIVEEVIIEYGWNLIIQPLIFMINEEIFVTQMDWSFNRKFMRGLIKKWMKIKEEVWLYGVSYKIDEEYEPMIKEPGRVLEVRNAPEKRNGNVQSKVWFNNL